MSRPFRVRRSSICALSLRLAIGLACVGAGLLCGPSLVARAAERPGHSPEVRVESAGRIDWVFALSNQSPATPPADWTPGYDATAQSYELYVPRKTRNQERPGLVLFLSPGPRSTGLDSFRAACEARNLIFASPHGAGNDVDMRKRVRIALDVLDDVRRKHEVDPDRTYVGGFSGGGRVACQLAFSLPEHFGGVIPVCAAGDLREEPWLRQRVRERLSVAHLTGETDFNRGEVERFRGPLLADVGVRSRWWVAPKTGHAVPGAPLVQQAIEWLDEGAAERRKLAERRPASRVEPGEEPSREAAAAALVAEGKRRLERPETVYSGLMQLKGALERWPDLAPAREARELLERQERDGDGKWAEEDVAEQRRFLIARARALSNYATGPLAAQYAPRRGEMLQAALRLWTVVIDDGRDEAAVAEGRKRVVELQAALESEGK